MLWSALFRLERRNGKSPGTQLDDYPVLQLFHPHSVLAGSEVIGKNKHAYNTWSAERVAGHAQGLPGSDLPALVDEMVGDWSKVQKLNALYEAKHARVLDLKIILDRCEKYQTTLQHMKPPSLKPLTIAYEKLTEAEESYTALELILDSLCNTKEKAERLNKNAARLEKELKKATGKRCPLCGRKNT